MKKILILLLSIICFNANAQVRHGSKQLYRDSCTYNAPILAKENIVTANGGKIGSGVNNPSYAFHADSTVGGQHFISTQNVSSMTATVDTSAGGGATISVTGNDMAGVIQLTTGTSPIASGHIARITYKYLFPGGQTSVILFQRTANGASGLSSLYVTGTGTYFDLFNTSLALTASTTYTWNYIVFR